MTKKESIVQLFVSSFPEFQDKLEEHFEYNEEILPHVFFGDEVNPVIINLIHENKDKRKLVSFFDFFEESMYNKGDTYVRQILSTTILARMGDVPDLIKVSYEYMGQNTRKLSEQLELFIEREH